MHRGTRNFGLQLRSLDALRELHLDHHPTVSAPLLLGSGGGTQPVYQLAQAFSGGILLGIQQDGHATVGRQCHGA